DGRALAARLFEMKCGNAAVGDRQAPVGGDHVNDIGRYFYGIAHFLHMHRRATLQYRHELAWARRLAMSHDDKRRAEFRGHWLKERLERRNAASRAADGHDWAVGG